jgi:hypothetical protein
MSIDSPVELLSILWISFILYISFIGQLYFSNESRERMIEILKKGNPLDKLNVIFFKPMPVGIRKISACFGLLVVTLFFVIIGFAKISIDLPSGLLIAILLVGLVLENAVILLLMSFKRKFQPDKDFKAGFWLFWQFTLASPPMEYYYLIMIILTFLYSLEIIKVLIGK